MADASIPALRAVELVPVEHQGRELVLLRDPQGVAREPLLLSPGTLQLLRFFDGHHDARDVQAAIARATGQILPTEEILAFVERLDALGYLDSLGYLERKREIALAYREAPHRPAQFAGAAYAADPERLRAELDDCYTAPEGPGLPDAPVSRTPVGLAAPHIDPARGGAVYAHAYRHLWGARPALVILLGVAHAGARQPFVLTAKDYATPLGRLATDGRLLLDLASRLDWDPLEEEETHGWEHSIEFQVAFLQHALSRGGREPRPAEPRLLPVLCAFDWSDCRAESAARGRIEAFLAALHALLDEEEGPVLILAGVDLAHLGRRFGDPRPLTESFREELRARDAATLAHVAAGEREPFLEEVARERDDRHWCGFPALYSLLSLLPGARGEIAGYGASLDAGRGSLVSFGALHFPGR